MAPALRKLVPEDIDSHLAECMNDYRKNIRATGARLAGWLPSDRLKAEIEAMLEKETEEEVRQAGLGALDRKRREEIALSLQSAFEKASNIRRWPLILSLLHIADPYLLDDPQDPLWIDDMLDKAPYIFRYYAKKTIRNKKKQMK